MTDNNTKNNNLQQRNKKNIFARIRSLHSACYILSLALILLFCNSKVYSANNVNLSSENEIFSIKDNLHSYKGVKNSNGKILIKPLYYAIRTNNENYYAIPYPSYDVYSLDGKKLLEIPNSSVEYYDGNFAIIHNEFGYYLADKKGKKLSKYYYSMMIEPCFRKVILFNKTDKDKYFGVMNFSGKILVSPEISLENKMIYVFPTENREIIGLLTNDSNDSDFKNKTFFFIENTGKKNKISEEEYYNYLKKYTDAQNNSKIYTSSWNTNSGNIYKWGIEENNHKIIENKYEKTSVETRNAQYFGYKNNSLWGVKSLKNEETILQPKFDKEIKVVNGYILVNKAPLGIYFDKNFNKIFELKNEELNSYFTDGFAVICKQNKYKYLYGFINEKGEIIIPCKYNYAKNFSEGLAAVQNEKDLWGYIDTNGKVVIDFKYKYANSFKNDSARVETVDKRYININKEGKTI